MKIRSLIMMRQVKSFFKHKAVVKCQFPRIKIYYRIIQIHILQLVYKSQVRRTEFLYLKIIYAFVKCRVLFQKRICWRGRNYNFVPLWGVNLNKHETVPSRSLTSTHANPYMCVLARVYMSFILCMYVT